MYLPIVLTQILLKIEKFGLKKQVIIKFYMKVEKVMEKRIYPENLKLQAEQGKILTSLPEMDATMTLLLFPKDIHTLPELVHTPM